MYCDQCGEQSRSNARYCSACGSPLSPTAEGKVGIGKRRWIAIGAGMLLLLAVLGGVLIPRVAQATGKAQLRPTLLKQIDEYERRVAKTNGMPVNPVCWNITQASCSATQEAYQRQRQFHDFAHADFVRDYPEFGRYDAWLAQQNLNYLLRHAPNTYRNPKYLDAYLAQVH
jgi:hypothetical protein